MPRFIGYALALFVVIPLTLTTSTAQSNKTKSVRDPGSVMPENKVPGTIESTARRLMHQLEAQGYAVARGYVKLYTEADCDASYAIMHTCYSNNPAAPYVVPVLPTWPDEWLDPRLAKGVFGPTHKGYSTTFRLDPREAIVILGRMPPPAKYFGLQTNVFTRQGDYNTESEPYEFLTVHKMAWLLNMFFAYLPWDGDRIQLLASVGNSINQRGHPGRVGQGLRSGSLLHHHARPVHGGRRPAGLQPYQGRRRGHLHRAHRQDVAGRARQGQRRLLHPDSLRHAQPGARGSVGCLASEPAAGRAAGQGPTDGTPARAVRPGRTR